MCEGKLTSLYTRYKFELTGILESLSTLNFQNTKGISKIWFIISGSFLIYIYKKECKAYIYAHIDRYVYI